MKKRTVRLQNAVLGEGMPKVCVPVMGENPEALAEMTDAARAEADIIELRLDSAAPTLDAEKARCACETVRERATCPFWRRCARRATAARATQTRRDTKRCSRCW